MSIEIGSALFVACEEANFLLHHIWIHILGSKYHPQVKQFRLMPEKDQVEPDPEKWLPLPSQNLLTNNMSDEEWEAQRAAFHSQLSCEEQIAVSDLRSRMVRFVILARRTDDLEKPKTYQLTFTVCLQAKAPAMEWVTNCISEVILTDVQTGEQKELPSSFGVLDCMNSRLYPNRSKESRFELAERYFA